MKVLIVKLISTQEPEQKKMAGLLFVGAAFRWLLAPPLP